LVVGLGVVGNAVKTLCENGGDLKVVGIDKKDDDFSYHKISEEATDADAIFLCLPTPTIVCDDNSCAQDIREIVKVLDLMPKKTLCILKSTVLPGVTRELARRNSRLILVHSPEFLSEESSVEDLYYQNKHYIGTGATLLESTKALLRGVYDRMYTVAGVIRKPSISFVTYEESELIKYTANCFYATKVRFFNEMQRLCEKMSASYKTVRSCAISSKYWISQFHTQVPGRHGIGYSGMCFPKDMKALGTMSDFIKDIDSSNDVLRSRALPLNDGKIVFTNADWETFTRREENESGKEQREEREEREEREITKVYNKNIKKIKEFIIRQQKRLFKFSKKG